MPTWTKDQVEKVLQDKKCLKSQRSIQNGVQFVLTDDTPVDWYQTGRVVVRGKPSELQNQMQELFASELSAIVIEPPVKQSVTSTAVALSQGTQQNYRVFIVYGHDAPAREQLELFVRRLRFEPVVLQNLPGYGDTIIEKLETFTEADFACDLLTPDDEGHRNGVPAEKKPRARQNVVLELGMVLARLGRKRVAILVKGAGLERPSDIDGLIYIAFNYHINEAKDRLAAHL